MRRFFVTHPLLRDRMHGEAHSGWVGLIRERHGAPYNARRMPAIDESSRSAIKHEWLYALPGGAMPAQVECAGQTFVHVQTFKHDFFAATGQYRGPDGLAVLKLNRLAPALGIPLRWIGRVLAGREIALYRALQDIANVPRYIGSVGSTGFMHAYVPGRPLGRYEPVPDDFFARLAQLLAELHRRDVAYVDLNKRQNILIGEDGQPYLIDFQISLHWPPRGWRGLWPARWLLRRFQHGDSYHLLKHKRRLRPDQLTSAEQELVSRLSLWIRLHRLVARPLTHLRRWLLRRLRAGETTVVAGSDAK